MRSSEITLIAFDGYYPRFIDEAEIKVSESNKSPTEQKQCRVLVSKTETRVRP
ncbi:hypothetical protein H336_19075 [Vibrio parahaemolyticus EN9701072]|nr:hypothetical protein H336_19075 [Vibrio parahaemolyticus EN9701072]